RLPLGHHELMSFGAHGQDGAGGGANHALGNTADEDVSQARATVRSEYDQVDLMRAGVADDLHLGRPLNYGLDNLSTDRPLRVEDTGQSFFRRHPGLLGVLRESEAHAKGRR